MTNTLKIQDFLAKISGKEVSWRWKQQAPWNISNCYQLTQCDIPEDLNLHQHSYEHPVSHTIIQPYQLAKTVCTCLPLQMTNLMTGNNITLCSRRICVASESSLQLHDWMSKCQKGSSGSHYQRKFWSKQFKWRRELRKTDHTSGCPVEDSNYNIYRVPSSHPTKIQIALLHAPGK